MAPIDYKAILTQAFGEYEKLLQDRQNLDLELAKKKQFIRATMNMLENDNEREAFNIILEGYGGELGLTDAIRKVLQAAPKKSFTATEVRDRLKELKFDFSSYKANPLASIHAVLTRLKPEEVESSEIDGVKAWRWVGEVYDWKKFMLTNAPHHGSFSTFNIRFTHPDDDHTGGVASAKDKDNEKADRIRRSKGMKYSG